VQRPVRQPRAAIGPMIAASVEQRCGTIRAPQPVQWLSDNGSIFAAHIEIALALNLVPCFTPVESPESNDKTVKIATPGHPNTGYGRKVPVPGESIAPIKDLKIRIDR
jgi:hypothetical protein